MKNKKALSAASYPSRIFKNDVTIKCPDCMVLCSGGCLMVAANSKNKETTTSLFFFSLSKEQGNRTGYPKIAPHIFGQLPCIPCPCRGL